MPGLGHYVMERPKVVNRQQPDRRAVLYLLVQQRAQINNTSLLSVFGVPH